MKPHRRFKLRIWWLALGYFAFYVPYSFLIKIVTSRFWPGINGRRFGFSFAACGTNRNCDPVASIITYNGWWKYAPRGSYPRGLVVLSGLGTAIIIATTTLSFAFRAYRSFLRYC